MKPEDCLAIHDGDLRVQGVDATVSIVRDRWGMPHICAQSAHDAFFGQGFCMGQGPALADRAHQAHGPRPGRFAAQP
jgi:hypothetical protein